MLFVVQVLTLSSRRMIAKVIAANKSDKLELIKLKARICIRQY